MNKLLCTIGLLAAIPAAAASADIVNSAGQFDRAIALGELGQSFTAVDASIAAIALAFSNLNPTLPNTPITMRLYSGAGFGGSIIQSVTETLPDVLPTTSQTPVFYDFDFTGVTLVPGQVYTISVQTTSFKVAAVYGPDAYSGGTLYNTGGAVPSEDLNFRVTAVPAPGALAALGGLLAFGARRRRV